MNVHKFLAQQPVQDRKEKWNERKTERKVFRYFLAAALFVKLKKQRECTMKRWNQNVLWHVSWKINKGDSGLNEKKKSYEKTLNELRRNCFFLIKKKSLLKDFCCYSTGKSFDILCFSWRFLLLLCVLTLFHGLFFVMIS